MKESIRNNSWLRTIPTREGSGRRLPSHRNREAQSVMKLLGETRLGGKVSNEYDAI
jgi:hypothetical protein